MDIKSKAGGPAGKLSNFTARHFVFDGVQCAGPEGLLQAFKFDDPEVQKQICMLPSREAKAKGTERNEIWQAKQVLWWQGVAYPRNSSEYQELLDRVYETLSYIPEFRKDLLATGDEILTHSIGERDCTKTILTEDEFCSRLMRIRKKLKIFAHPCPHQCKCMCHEYGGMHIVACCEGPCKVCGRNIKFGMMQDHLDSCCKDHGKE